jgi:hypothetical protein
VHDFWKVDFFCFSQVDDGTAVIDCNHPHPQPTQPKVNAKRTSSELSAKPEPPPALKPVAKVGNFVQVVGKVRAVHSSRQIIVDRIGLSMNITSWLPLTELLFAETCSSPNDELVHTRTVRQLHRTSYSLSDPFVIPPRICQLAFTTPIKNRVMVMQTPSTIRSSPPSSICSSPVKPESLEHIHKVRLHSNE